MSVMNYFLRRTRITTRLIVLCGVATACALGSAWLSQRLLDPIMIGGSLERQAQSDQALLADVLPSHLTLHEAYVICLQLVSLPLAQQPQETGRLALLRRDFHERARQWAAQHASTALGDALTQDLIVRGEQFYTLVFDEFLPSQGKVHGPSAKASHASQRAMQARLAQSFELYRQSLLRVTELARQQQKAHSLQRQLRLEQTLWAHRMLLLFNLLLGLGLWWALYRSMARPMARAVGVATAMAQGRMPAKLQSGMKDEVGQLVLALEDMADRLDQTSQAQRAAEMQMRLSKEALESLLDSASVMVVGVDSAGRVALFNREAEELSGYNRRQLLGQNWAEFGLVVDVADWQRNLAPSNLHNIPLGYTQKIVTAAGDVRSIHWRNSVQTNAGDCAVSVVSFGLDITPQLELEKALVEAKSQAERASQTKSDFLANMSHEIRTPMNAIIGMTALALRTELSAKQRNYLLRVEAAAQGLLKLINDVLDFSKIEAGKLHFEDHPFSLAQVLDQTTNLLGHKAEDKRLELLFDCPMDLPDALVGDPVRLGQVLANLLNNAIKFTARGEVTVRVRCLQRSSAQVQLLFQAQDTGIGLSAEQCSRLFRPFEQADVSTTRRFGGTGLGLSIARRLVEMMHGTLTVDSEPGVGSTFSFTAWLGLQVEQQRMTQPSAEEMRHLRVLVVDDNSSARTIMASMLEALHIRHTLCATGEQAVAAWLQAQQSATPYRMVFMDWRMPDMDGLEAVRRIRQHASVYASLIAVMVTAYSRDDLMESAGDVRLDGILEKPISPSRLFDIIVRSMGRATTFAPQSTLSQIPSYEEMCLHLRGARVLLAEDNEVNQELAVDILRQAGLLVEVAWDGAEALSLLQQQPFDAVLMDWQMPVMDGLQATRQIRNLGYVPDWSHAESPPYFATLPIIAMTANALAGDREQCLDAGMNDYLMKPLVVEDLLLTLSHHIAHSSKRLTGVSPPEPLSFETLQADTKTPVTVVDDLPSLEGVNMAIALRRLRGNQTQYRMLMTSMRDKYCNSVEQLRTFLSLGDTDSAQRLAHNLKTLAASLGADDVDHAAQALEHALKHQTQGAVEDVMESLATAFEKLQQSLRSALEASPAVAGRTPSPWSQASFQQHLAQLQELLAQDDGRALHCVQAIEHALEGHLGAAGFAPIAQAVRAFEHERALALLRHWAQMAEQHLMNRSD